MRNCFLVEYESLEYRKSLDLQKQLRERKESNRDFDDFLLVLQHNHVYTIGRKGSKEDILAPENLLKEEGIGYSSFVSLGNKADLDETDFIDALADDENTLGILAYLESISRGPEFVKVCRDVTKKKPVIVLKAGRSEAGARAASSHTGSMTGTDTTYDVAFEKCGVIRADTTQELFDMAFAFSYMPIPKGNKIVIITNAGGPGILATDVAEKFGLELATISPEIKSKMKEFLPSAQLQSRIPVNKAPL
ncbi:unnamed protein product [marine sediment metagenome]|uniref:Succinyl-CoA synthetase-like flavodoxin domain-containing protein n=1 Tax=marine sediment metagenome TaxID=412755 RepID=X1F1F6_9ZZZZ